MFRNRYGNHYRNLVRLGLPIMVGQLGMIVLGFADTIMVGHHGTDDLAAASFVNNMFGLVIVFSTGFSYGLTPFIGSLFGKGRTQDIGRDFKNGLLANIAMGLLLTGLMTLLYFHLDRLGQPEDLLPLIRPYYLVQLASLTFILAFNAFKQFSDGITDTVTPMWIMISANLLNIVGNWLLIYGKCGLPELGLLGAGLATFISRVFMVLVAAAAFLSFRRYRIYHRGFFKVPASWKVFLNIGRLGLPVALQMGMETASFSLSTIMVGWIDKISLASHQVMLTIGQLGYMLYYGMAAAVAVRVSNFRGQNDVKNVRDVSRAGFHLIMLLAFTVSVFVFVLRDTLGSWFTDDAEVQLMVAQLIIPFCIYQFGDGMQCTYANSLRGIADVKPVMAIAFLSYFVISLPAAYIFGFVFDWGLTGIWFSFPLGLTSAGLMFRARFRKTLREVENNR